jgi:hypothetical protein
MRDSIVVMFTLIVLGSPRAVNADEPPPPELKMLSHMIGTWDEVVTNKPAEWTPKAGRATSVTRKAWSLGGRFMRMDGAWSPAKTEFVSFLAYDPATKEFRSWYFDSAGAFPRGTLHGTWDDKNRTIHWSGSDEFGNKSVGTHKIIDKDTHEWMAVTTDKNGKVLIDLQATNKRRKE